MEQWKEIKNSGYFASTEGQIKNKKNQILKGSDRGQGYKSVHINLGEGCKQYFIHRLILETFNPIPNSELFHVDHIDKNKQNNKLENLRWVSANENNKLKNNPQEPMNFIANNNVYFLLGQIIGKFGEEKTVQLLNEILTSAGRD